jgi:hypothetical protein
MDNSQTQLSTPKHCLPQSLTPLLHQIPRSNVGFSATPLIVTPTTTLRHRFITPTTTLRHRSRAPQSPTNTLTKRNAIAIAQSSKAGNSDHTQAQASCPGPNRRPQHRSQLSPREQLRAVVHRPIELLGASEIALEALPTVFSHNRH